jgi:hypothetical protein
MTRWNADPRASRPAWDPNDPTCATSDERQAIECWMGAKWGFFQFPPDPARDDPPLWRPVPVTVEEVAHAPGGTTVTLAFDLALPLPAQLDAARVLLAGRLAKLRRSGQRLPLGVSEQAAAWERLLDLLEPGNADRPGQAEALAMSREGYRGILRLLG